MSSTWCSSHSIFVNFISFPTLTSLFVHMISSYTYIYVTTAVESSISSFSPLIWHQSCSTIATWDSATRGDRKAEEGDSTGRRGYTKSEWIKYSRVGARILISRYCGISNWVPLPPKWAWNQVYLHVCERDRLRSLSIHKGTRSMTGQRSYIPYPLLSL